jgi:MoaA/NifB/PqqE/SkfB family radical SAM enzyme
LVRGTYGWAEITKERKRELIDAIVSGKPTQGPSHLELDLTDRCNVDCYFCSQMDVRTKEQIPYPRIVGLIDELATNGLKTIRLAGGGDPLFHREIIQVLDLLGDRNVIIDNITTNGLGLTPPVAERLVRNKCREVLFSLNAADAADYSRMMQVKPAIFDKVIANIRHLAQSRGPEGYPGVIVQFLLDRENYFRLPEMYRLARELGADVIAVNVVLDIPLQRIDHSVLLTPDDKDLVRPFIEEVLREDRGRGLLQICPPHAGWVEMVDEIQKSLGTTVNTGFTTAPSYKEENGKCFFGWYTAVIRGNGDLYPCCLLLNPEYTPLGNTMNTPFKQQWNGPMFNRMREEMRDVFMTKGQIDYTPDRFKTLRSECVESYKCWLKSLYFRGDQDFYRELGEALEQARKREVRFVGTPKQMKRAAEVYLHQHPRVRQALSAEWVHRAYDWARNRSRPLRATLKRRLGWNLTDAA